MKQDTCFKIESLTCPVFIGTELWREIDDFVLPFLDSGGVYILTDHNTQQNCLPVLINHLPKLKQQPLFSIAPGELSKDLHGLERIWIWMMEAGAVKDSLLINLGGGVVSDLGGFAAATYKRGIRYINIPTSLIGQADAAMGGKTGINIAGIKNQAGLFCNPSAVFINPVFLATLPENHFRSGFGEIIKCAALSGNGFWDRLKNKNIQDKEHLFNLILDTVNFKCRIVSQDPFDQSTRKMLNFGHTVGHALESFSNMLGGLALLHGEAVAAGMICESYLSFETAGLPKYELEEITDAIKAFFALKPLENSFFEQFIKIMEHDKKKTINGIVFSLLESLGHPCFISSVDRMNIIRSFEFYNKINQK